MEESYPVEKRVPAAPATPIPVDINTNVKSNNIISPSPAQMGGRFVENPLDQYANYTYHVKFWITSQDNETAIQNAATASNASNSSSKSAIDQIPKVIIAESGVTEGFGIKEFSFVNLVGTNPASRNTQDLTWTMTIMEPYGLSLPDKINSAAQEFGILNWYRSKYYLQIWFTGYNENGEPVQTGLYHKIFCLLFTSMNITASEAGSIYDCKGIMDGGYGMSNEAAIIKCSIKIDDKSTIGQSIDKLATALTENVKKIELTNMPTVSFEIKIPNFMRNWAIDTGKIYQNDSRSWKMDIKAGAQPEITITAGTDIAEVVRYIISRSPQAVAWESGLQAGQGQASFAAHAILKNLKVHSQVKYTHYDAWTQDYVKKITYTLFPYEETRIYTNVDQVKDAQKPEKQQAKIDYLFRIGRIQKKYDWIYTGQNLNVIKFDLKINNFWAIAVPQYGGQNTLSNQTIGHLAGDNTALHIRQKTIELEDAKKQLASAQQVVQNNNGLITKLGRIFAQAGASQDLTGRSQELVNTAIQDEDNTAKAKVNTIENQLRDLQNQIAQKRSEYIVPIDVNPSTVLTGNSRTNRVSQARLKLQALQTVYAEDQTIQTVDNQFPITVKYLPEANMAEGNQATASPSSTGNKPGNEPASRTLLGTYHGNLESFNKENINISLEIRGDPYWIGYDNLTQNAQVVTGAPNNPEYAEYLGGDNMFYFNYKTGQSPNEDTGFMTFDNESQTVAGYYVVMRVTNTFREGSFTQTLQSIKDIFSQSTNNKPADVKTQDKLTNTQSVSTIAPPSDIRMNSLNPDGNFVTITGTSQTPVFGF